MFANKKALIVAAVLLLVVLGGTGYVMLSGGSGGGAEPPNPADLQIIDFDDPAAAGGAAGGGGGGTDVAAAVQATIAAMSPTETPVPTPDIAATLQAELAASRQATGPLLGEDPLRQGFGRNPYLNPVEYEYFQRMGPEVWRYVRVWLYINEVLRYETDLWSAELLDHNLRAIRPLLLGNLSSGNVIPQQGSNEVVRAYAEEMNRGFSEVRNAALQMEAALSYLHEQRDEFYEEFERNVQQRVAEQDPELALEERLTVDSFVRPEFKPSVEDRGRLVIFRRDIEQSLENFHSIMSAYGCSVCGELFRAPPVE